VSWPRNLSAWLGFWRTYRQYGKASSDSNRPTVMRFVPCLGDDTVQTPVEPIYFYQDAWAFERIVDVKPEFHVDVGSHYNFVALLSKVVHTVMVDIRPLSVTLDSIHFCSGSILNLPFGDKSVSSVSSLCVVEHIGLGRYGDPLDADGTEKAVAELKRIVQSGGNLYLSLPIDDRDTVYFNAHRAFCEASILKLIHPFIVVSKGYIYGTRFTGSRESGFGTACYHLRRPGQNV
jgi:SAM-dependent methyltransferase